MKLFSENIGGNLHEAVVKINRLCPEIIPNIVTLSCDSPYNHTIVVYRAEEPAAHFRRRDEQGKRLAEVDRYRFNDNG